MTQGIIEQLPVFDVGHYRTLPDEDDEKHRIAQGMAESLRQTSCLLVSRIACIARHRRLPRSFGDIAYLIGDTIIILTNDHHH